MRNNKGFSLIELLIVVVIIGIIAAIAVPNLLASRRSANGASAVEAMRLFHTVQATYQAGVGNGNFGGIADLRGQDLIDQVLGGAASSVIKASGGAVTPGAGGFSSSVIPKSGYIFIADVVAAGNGTLADFGFAARPASSTGINRSGDRQFFVDATGVIRASTTANDLATANSSPIGN